MADIHAEGVDVANHQMGLDWRDLARAGMTFGWFKLTEGVQYTDPWADEHHASALAAGMVDGAYQFARPDTNTPRSDAEWFCHVLTSRGLHEQGHLPPVLDIEDPREGFRLTDQNVVGASSIRAWCRDWLEIAAQKTGRHDLVTYASASFITDRLRGEGFLPHEDMRLWVAHYGVTPGRPAYLTNKVIAHQYTSSGTVNGWPKGLDFNALLVPLSSLVSGAPVPNPGGGGGGGVPPPNGENRSAANHTSEKQYIGFVAAGGDPTCLTRGYHRANGKEDVEQSPSPAPAKATAATTRPSANGSARSRRRSSEAATLAVTTASP